MGADMLALTRHGEWDDGHRRLEAERGDSRRYQRLVGQVELVTRRAAGSRSGQTYTLAELAAAYGDAERWARAPSRSTRRRPGWPRDLALVSRRRSTPTSAAR